MSSWYTASLFFRAMAACSRPDATRQVFAGSWIIERVSRWCRAIIPTPSPTIRNITLLIAALTPLAIVYSPKLYLGHIGGGDAFFIRADDLAILLLLAASCVQQKCLLSTPLDSRIWLFIIIAAVGTLLGILTGSIDNPQRSFLYLGKMLEYFLVYYVILNLVRSERDVRRLVGALLLVTLSVSLYGLIESQWQHKVLTAAPGFVYRIYERGLFNGDANHVATYLVFTGALAGGLALWARSASWRLLGVAAWGASSLAIFITYSRSAYVAWAFTSTLLIFLRSPRLFLVCLIAALALLPLLAPESVMSRVSTIQSELSTLGSESTSLGYRVEQLVRVMHDAGDYLVLGAGVGARHRAFYENYFLFLFAETGVAGLLCFFSIIGSIYYVVLRAIQTIPGDFERGLLIGYLVGLAGILVVSNMIVTLLLTRVATPFWFATGLVIWLALQRTTSCSKEDRYA